LPVPIYGLSVLIIYYIAIDPLTPTTIYASTPGRGIFKSSDGGENWVEMNEGLIDKHSLSLTIDSSTPTTIYTVTFGGVFKSTNGADSWMTIGLSGPVLSSLVINSLTPTIIYAGTDEGIFRINFE